MFVEPLPVAHSLLDGVEQWARGEFVMDDGRANALTFTFVLHRYQDLSVGAFDRAVRRYRGTLCSAAFWA